MISVVQKLWIHVSIIVLHMVVRQYSLSRKDLVVTGAGEAPNLTIRHI